MARYVAFLRAINVGGHTVTKEQLIGVFESLALENVRTFLASGNVIFEAGKVARPTLEKKIASTLEQRLGYEVATFLRTEEEIKQVLAYRGGSSKLTGTAVAYNIGFLATPLDKSQQQRLMQFRTEIDEFATDGREVYWWCRTKQSESSFNGGKLEKALGVKVTFRSESSLTKLAAKLAEG